MKSKFFPQYLFNTNQMAEDKIHHLMKEAANNEASLAVKALCADKLQPELFLDLLGQSEKDTEAKLLEAKVVDEEGLAAFREENDDMGLKFIQTVINDGIYTPEKLTELLKDFDNGHCPVCQVIEKEINPEFEQETEQFCHCVSSFLDCLVRFTGDIAIVTGADGVDPLDSLGDKPEDFNAVSQRIEGDRTFVVGIVGDDKTFCKIASAYGGEDISQLNDLAVDSVSELVNVVNGIYAVEVAKDNLKADLDMPRSSQMAAFPKPHTVVVKVKAAFGDMYLILAKEEFLPPITIF